MEDTFEILNSWVFGDKDPLLESFARVEWQPCGKPERILYRALVLSNSGKLNKNEDALESWSKSADAALQFIKSEYKSFASGKTVVLLSLSISANDQIVDMEETEVDDVYEHEQEVICKGQSIDESMVVARYRFENDSLSEIK